MTAEETQGDYCGFELDRDKLPQAIEPNTCDRPTWGDRNRCIWHAKDDQKPVDRLAEEWETLPNRVDGLCITNVTVGDRLNFGNRRLYGADFRKLDASEADFRGADLFKADFTNATLRSTRFDDPQTNLEEAVFSKSTCKDTRFQQATLHNTSFRNATADSAKFQHADAAEGDFKGTSFKQANLIHSNFRNAKFDNAELYETKCDAAILEDVSLYGADIRSASFIETDLHDADFRNVEADHKTEFGTQLYREYISDFEVEPDCITSWKEQKESDWTERGPANDLEDDYDYEEKYESEIEEYWENVKLRHLFVGGISRLVTRNPLYPNSEKIDKNLAEAEEIYSDIKQLYRTNPVAGKHRKFNVREKETKRKIAYLTGDISWLRWSFLRRTMRYGESALKVVFSTAFTVLFFAGLYPIWGLSTGKKVLQYTFSGKFSFDQIWTVLFFSLRRLLTASNGATTPVGIGEEIALIETASGAILTAMLVFVLGRRATS